MPNKKIISIVVPVYNEMDVLETFYARIKPIIDNPQYFFEVILVNDGSKDGTLAILKNFRERDCRFAYINLSRNFGKEKAMAAGFDIAQGDAVIVIDADLQDPPELIPDLIAEWEAGYDNVYGKRNKRAGETWLKRLTAHFFYRIIGRLSEVIIPEDSGDFRIMSRRAVDALKQIKEANRFTKGLFAWVGYKQKPFYYDRDPRAMGTTKFNYWKLWNFAIDGFTSFTIVPLKLATYLGLIIASISFIFGIFIIIKTLLLGDDVQGYPSLMTVITFLGGTQLLFIGIIGEYLGRMFMETKNRPLYLIDIIEITDKRTLQKIPDMKKPSQDT